MSFDYSDSAQLQKLAASAERSAAAQEKLTDVFTRVAVALETLAHDVHAMREEMHPALDKQKLAAPRTGTA